MTRTVLWRVTAIAVAVLFFVLATNDAVYDVTSPPQMSWHVLARKLYSIVAFAVVGFTADKALGPTAYPAFRAALLVAAYSTAIEIAQFFQGTHEGLRWNAVDIACGALGGLLGAAAGRVVSAITSRAS